MAASASSPWSSSCRPRRRPGRRPRPRRRDAGGSARPTEWPFRAFSADDYPAAALRGQQEGFVVYRLEIGRTGGSATARSAIRALGGARCRHLPHRLPPQPLHPARDSAGATSPIFATVGDLAVGGEEQEQ